MRLGDTDFDLASREHSLQRWLGPDQEPAREPEVEAMIAAVQPVLTTTFGSTLLPFTTIGGMVSGNSLNHVRAW